MPSFKKFARSWSGTRALFVLTVALPTLIAALYFGLVASDVYISESRFVVRTPQRQMATGLGAVLQSAGISRAQDDVYTVHDFMQSRDALQKINKELPLPAIFGDKAVDLFSRFNPLGLDGSLEALYLYYQKRIELVLDSTSSVSTLKVSAFSAQDAARINRMLLEMGEQMINALNERARQDLVSAAAKEVDAASDRVKAAAAALASYRSNKTVFDPERQSALQLQHVSKLQDELIAAKTQLAQLRALAPENPQIPSLQKRVTTLQSEIDSAMSNVAGGDRSLSVKAAEYEQLAIERAFSEKQWGAAMASLEQARNEAQRKQLYLERIVQPNTPDMAMQPRRIRSVLAVAIFGLVAWGILSLLLAGAREHHD